MLGRIAKDAAICDHIVSASGIELGQMFKSTHVLIAACFILPAIGLVALEWMAVPPDSTAACEFLCRVYRVLRDFQTLIAGGIAVVAAWYAATPVWAQLKKMSLQQDIMARDLIAERISGIEGRFNKLRTDVVGRIIEIDWSVLRVDPSGIAEYVEMDASTAHDVSMRLEEILGDVRQHLHDQADTYHVEAAKRKLAASIKALASTLDRIVIPEGLSKDPEVSEEKLNELQVDAKIAQNELRNRIQELQEVNKEFARIGVGEIRKIKRRLRAIDDAILAEPQD